jgi:hypothetical protein
MVKKIAIIKNGLDLIGKKIKKDEMVKKNNFKNHYK